MSEDTYDEVTAENQNDTQTAAGQGSVTLRSIDSANASNAVTVTTEQAVQQCKDYMAGGKWLNLVAPNGESDVITDPYSFFENTTTAGRRLEAAEEVQIMVALAGGTA
jgi:hypothetical protein